MYTLDHPNVLTLSGVCLDGGTAPYIIMPFMANGSISAYLKTNRSTLVVSQEQADSDEEVRSYMATTSFSSILESFVTTIKL